MRPPPGDNVGNRRVDLLKIAQDVTPEAIMDTIVAFEPFASQKPEAHLITAAAAYARALSGADL